MKQAKHLERYLILFIPWAAASLAAEAPIESYIIAWVGSFFIFFMTLSGAIRPLPDDRPFAEQLMRPIFIVQIIFAGYMACTSIFYFLSVLGYENFKKAALVSIIDRNQLALTAQCQRYYCLAHAAFASGILLFMNYPVKSKYYIETEKLANLLMYMAALLFPVSIIFQHLPGLNQFYFQLSSLSFIAGTLALAFAIPLRKVGNTLLCLAFYAFNFYQALTSGFKEPIIISTMVLGLFLYPTYKKLVTITFVPAIIILFFFLPSYVNSFRQTVWNEDETADDASKQALDAALNNDDVDNTNWYFLTFRLSEVDMFTKYIKSTPSQVNYYGFTILEQSAIAIVPRVFWPSKPNTEDLIMQRVYNAGVINKNSNVSAKPPFVVDAYLSYGPFGILVYLFAYGAIAQSISIKAEKLFGGYILGTALIFSGLFQIFWRGLSFEFIINAVFWSYVSMWVIFKIMRSRKILKEV